MRRTSWLIVALAGLVYAYFVVFPADVSTVLAPVWDVLYVSQAASPWLYVLLSVALVCWVIVRVWGRPARTGTV